MTAHTRVKREAEAIAFLAGHESASRVVVALTRGRSGTQVALARALTCDVCGHEALRPDDLHLHHADIFQVVK